MTTPMPSYKGHRYPVEIINHCVWLYFRFPLSFREVEELMLERGVGVGYETIRRWCAKFGQAYANGLRRQRLRPGDKWHLDEVFIRINGTQHYLWRAVDQHGNVLDVLIQSRRNALAAKRFFRRLLKGAEFVPRVSVTDKLGSYGVAHREMLSSVEHRQSKLPRPWHSVSRWRCRVVGRLPRGLVSRPSRWRIHVSDVNRRPGSVQRRRRLRRTVTPMRCRRRS